MNHQEAIEIYLTRLRYSHVIINRIMRWNPNLSTRENSTAMNLNYDVTLQLKRRFRLKSKYVGRGNNFRGIKK